MTLQQMSGLQPLKPKPAVCNHAGALGESGEMHWGPWSVDSTYATTGQPPQDAQAAAEAQTSAAAAPAPAGTGKKARKREKEVSLCYVN